MELMKPPSPNTNELITSEPIYGFIGKFYRVTTALQPLQAGRYLSADPNSDSLSLLSWAYFRTHCMFLMEPQLYTSTH